MGVAGATVAGMLTFATPAAAHTMSVYVYSGVPPIAQVTVYDGHEHGYVCDLKADGLGVYGRFKITGGAIIDVADLDGSGGNCPGYTAPIGKNIIAIEAVVRSNPTKSSGWWTVD